MAYAQGCWEQKEWNPFWGKEFKVQLAKSDIRKGGVGRNYYKHIKGTEDQYLYNTQRYDIKGTKSIFRTENTGFRSCLVKRNTMNQTNVCLTSPWKEKAASGHRRLSVGWQ